MSCDRNICATNEYNGIGCDECCVSYDTAVQREQDAYDSGFAKAIEGALEIIKDYDLYKSDEDGDLVACKWEVWAEIKALKGEQE